MSEPMVLNIRNPNAKNKVCAVCGKTFKPNLVKTWPWRGNGKIYCSRKCAREALDGKRRDNH